MHDEAARHPGDKHQEPAEQNFLSILSPSDRSFEDSRPPGRRRLVGELDREGRRRLWLIAALLGDCLEQRAAPPNFCASK